VICLTDPLVILDWRTLNSLGKKFLKSLTSMSVNRALNITQMSRTKKEAIDEVKTSERQLRI